jgi:hypothetical protein
LGDVVGKGGAFVEFTGEVSLPVRKENRDCDLAWFGVPTEGRLSGEGGLTESEVLLCAGWLSLGGGIIFIVRI